MIKKNNKKSDIEMITTKELLGLELSSILIHRESSIPLNKTNLFRDVQKFYANYADFKCLNDLMNVL